MTNALRWTLRIAGWVLVVLALAPSWEHQDQGPGVSSRMCLGLRASPLYVRSSTTIRAGVANVPEPSEVQRSSGFHLASWSALALLVGAVLVTASNRRVRVSAA